MLQLAANSSVSLAWLLLFFGHFVCHSGEVRQAQHRTAQIAALRDVFQDGADHFKQMETQKTSSKPLASWQDDVEEKLLMQCCLTLLECLHQTSRETTRDHRITFTGVFALKEVWASFQTLAETTLLKSWKTGKHFFTVCHQSSQFLRVCFF